MALKGKKKMGRPPLNPKDRRSVMLNVKTTPAEAARIRAEAKRLRMPVGEILMRPWRQEREKE